MRWIVIGLLASFFNCGHPTKVDPVPSSTPWPTVVFATPRVSISPGNTTISFGSLLLPPDTIVEGVFRVALDRPRHVVKIWSFIGVDSGNIGEFAVDLETNRRIYQRSLHKETLGIYDAWDSVVVDELLQSVQVHVLGHMLSKPGHLEIEIILETDD